MHARELVELAAIVSAHGPVLIRSGERIPTESIEQYWTTSKVRLDRWSWRLRSFVGKSDAAGPEGWDKWPAVRGVLEEILTGEMLSRVWSAVLCAYDRARGIDDAEPVVRSVMIGHMEARHRVLNLMVRGSKIDPKASALLNHIRRRTECWTDLLVGNVACHYKVAEFAFDQERASQFADDLRARAGLPSGRQVWRLLFASLRAAFQHGMDENSPNPDLNARIATAIISCFPMDLFDSTGLMRSLWLLRMANVAEDTQGKIEDLIRLDSSTAVQKESHKSSFHGERRRLFGT